MEIRNKTYGKRQAFDDHTIKKTEVNARKALNLITSVGEFPEVVKELESAIAIYKKHITEHSSVSDETNRTAIGHVEFGIELFLDITEEESF